MYNGVIYLDDDGADLLIARCYSEAIGHILLADSRFDGRARQQELPANNLR